MYTSAGEVAIKLARQRRGTRRVKSTGGRYSKMGWREEVRLRIKMY